MSEKPSQAELDVDRETAGSFDAAAPSGEAVGGAVAWIGPTGHIYRVLPDFLKGQAVIPLYAAPAALPEDTKRLHDFFTKYALGQLTAPSCLVCGQSTQGKKIWIQHAELPSVVVCESCRTAALPEGYVMLPKDLTDDMHAAFEKSWLEITMPARNGKQRLNDAYKALLAAGEK